MKKTIAPLAISWNIRVSRRKYRHQSLLFRHVIYRLLLLLTCLPATEALSDPLSLGKDIPYSVITDPHGQLSLEQAVEQLQEQVLKERSTFSRGYVRDAFWLRFELPEEAFAGQERWLELGPNFVDDIRLFVRPIDSRESWLKKRTGDVSYGQSDLDYRNPVFILRPPPPGAVGYEVMVRVQTSSTTILQTDLWQPAELMGQATKSTSFWSFYLGVASLSTVLALVLALVLGGPLLWSVTVFSTSFLLVAAVRGYIDWVFPPSGIPLQHYLTSVMSLIAFGALLWLCSEAINLRQHLPRAHKALITLSVMILSLLVLIPLDQYGLAVRIQTALYLLGVGIFICSTLYVWWRSNFQFTTLLLGAAPLVVIAGSLSAVFSTLGLVPFRNEIYVLWQYALIALILLVTATAVYRVREQKLKEIEKRQIASELKAERDAGFHQRQFMGMVSHEFRTPLAVISASLENLWSLESDGENSARVLRYDKIRRAADRLVLLSDNCLSDARLAADNLYVNPQRAKLVELVRSAAELVQLSGDHQLMLTVNGQQTENSKTQDWTVQADVALIRIALSNVIDNAVKHSSGECIHVDCSVRDGKPTVQIRDEGPGIKGEDASWIFERYRSGAYAKRGVGLGLYIAREISRAHGGDLRLASTGPEGNCFELTFKSGDEDPVQ